MNGRADRHNPARVRALVAAGALLALLVAAQEGLSAYRAAVQPAAGADRAPGGGYSAGQLLATRLLGGFRAIFVDLIWVQASLAQENKELWQIERDVEVILTLQPRNVEARTFWAWNLAYNISGNNWPEADEGPQRWPWIVKGIRLLREGMETNPRNPVFPGELGELFRHKSLYDDYFRRQVEKPRRSGEAGPDQDPGGFGENPFVLAMDYFRVALDRCRETGLTPKVRWFTLAANAGEMRGDELRARGEERREPALLDEAALAYERAADFARESLETFPADTGEGAYLRENWRRLPSLRGRAAACRERARSLRTGAAPEEEE